MAQNESDMERQFQEDLEKATALSLETLALDQFKRKKLYGEPADSDAGASTNNIYKSNSHHYLSHEQQQRLQQLNQQRPNTNTHQTQSIYLQNSASVGSIARPPIVPPRRHSEVRELHTKDEPDLISFTSPTGAAAALDLAVQNDGVQNFQNQQSQNIGMPLAGGAGAAPSATDSSHQNFLQMVNEMHDMNKQLQQMPKMPQYGAPSPYGFSQHLMPQHNLATGGVVGGGVAVASAASMQLVPYQQPTSSAQQQPVPLTADQLTKLYNMNYAVQPYNQQLVRPQMGGPIPSMYPHPPVQHHQQQQQQQQQQQIFRSAAYLPPTGIQSPAFISSAVVSRPAIPPSTIGVGFNNHSIINQTPQIPSRPLLMQPTHQQQQQHQQQQSTSVSSDSFVTRRSKSKSGDLIDLNHGMDDTSRVSVLEAFDPLRHGDDDNSDDDGADKGDNASECATSFYSESDPFDYLYSCGTQYSDPVYEAVNRIDRSPLSPGAPSIGWNIPGGAGGTAAEITQTNNFTGSWVINSIATGSLADAPPLPPRNSQPYDPFLPIQQQQQQQQQQVLDRRKIPTKLYQNVVVRKTYDPELVGFYTMVKQLRNQYKYNDVVTNVGHVMAAEFSNLYPEATSIKLLVHPSLKCIKNDDGDGGGSGSSGNSRPNSCPTVGGTSGGSGGLISSSSIQMNNGDKGQVEGYGPPVPFTCNIHSTVEHVIMHVFCALEGQIMGSVNDYFLKPLGVTEWLSATSKLSQLECVHDSLKLEQDIQLGLCPKTSQIDSAIGRTMQDDLRDAELKFEHILSHQTVDTINYDNLMILLETLEDEIAKLESIVSDPPNPHTIFSCSGVIQAVKMICALLGSLDTIEITDAVTELKKLCSLGQPIYSYNRGESSSTGVVAGSGNGSKLDIVSEIGDYAQVKLRPRTIGEQITHRCNVLRDCVQALLETYSRAFQVDFSVNQIEYTTRPVPISNVSEPVMVHLMCLHRPPPNWRHDDYMLGAQIYHGTRYIGDAVVTQCSNEISGIFPRLKFESWLNFENIPICTLPRESRLIFVLYGCTTEPTENNDSSSQTITNGGNTGGSGGTMVTTSTSSISLPTTAASSTATTTNATNTSNNTDSGSGPVRRVTKIELGWSSIQFFDFERKMIQGSYLLSLWPPTTDKFLGPAPAKGTHPHGYHCPVLSIEIPNYGGDVIFPESVQNQAVAPRLDFNSLDRNLQQELIDTAEQGYPSAVDKREVLWEKRYYLQALPHALPKVLHAAHSWDFASLVDLHALIRSWQPLSPLQSLELFLPRYPDIEVRAQAVRWISKMPNDQLVDFLPQLLQALKHDSYEASAMAKFLLSRALESPRIAHHLYWILVHSLPGDSPQNSPEQMSTENETSINQARYNRRNLMMLRALLAICGEKLSARFLAQNMMCKSLADCAVSVKQCKESMRQKTLVVGLENVNQILLERPTSLPLGPGLEVIGVKARSSSYFNSNTLPLKINFIGSDKQILPAIFKAGDDLQQDMLTIQLVRIMDKLWLNEGLDLKMVTFNCVPTGQKKGMIEMISDAETLRKIQVEWGLTGSFKDKPIAEWLARQNPSQLEYQRAVDNFTVSCAGYSVATYILGICDRHNDNIMLKTSGHLFHIDFGKFLGDAQMFGNFKRDRTPFVLTSDMAYVINGGDRPSTKFHHFVDLCCQAFNIVRRHGDLILHMLALMATSGIPGVTADAVNYVRNALLPGQSNPEAAASFAKMIHISLKSWFTQFNFFLHNLAQIRFSGDEGSGDLLSFVPRPYTMAQDGRLKSVTVHGYQKRYDLEKYYTFILKVTRQNQPDPAYLFRSYKEFCEFHQKLCLHYPLAKLHSLPSGIHVGRSNIKTVADRRLPEIRLFLISLFNAADEIAHSDLVYTFFHPLLRDQQEQDIHVAKVKETKQINPKERVCGEVKLSLQYHRGALTVMIHHARSLPPTTGGQEPNTYVKAYLKPDPTKVTKRKTKVVRKNCFPSFMETLEYRMPIEAIQNRILQVTVWSHDSLQENEFLGGVELLLTELDLSVELVKWFQLGYLSRS